MDSRTDPGRETRWLCGLKVSVGIWGTLVPREAQCCSSSLLVVIPVSTGLSQEQEDSCFLIFALLVPACSISTASSSIATNLSGLYCKGARVLLLGFKLLKEQTPRISCWRKRSIKSWGHPEEKAVSWRKIDNLAGRLGTEKVVGSGPHSEWAA